MEILKNTILNNIHKMNTTEIISFRYFGDIITSDDNNKLVFYGSKYIVMHNDKDTTTTLYETDNVMHFSKKTITEIPTKE